MSNSIKGARVTYYEAYIQTNASLIFDRNIYRTENDQFWQINPSSIKLPKQPKGVMIAEDFLSDQLLRIGDKGILKQLSIQLNNISLLQTTLQKVLNIDLIDSYIIWETLVLAYLKLLFLTADTELFLLYQDKSNNDAIVTHISPELPTAKEILAAMFSQDSFPVRMQISTLDGILLSEHSNTDSVLALVVNDRAGREVQVVTSLKFMLYATLCTLKTVSAALGNNITEQGLRAYFANKNRTDLLQNCIDECLNDTKIGQAPINQFIIGDDDESNNNTSVDTERTRIQMTNMLNRFKKVKITKGQ